MKEASLLLEASRSQSRSLGWTRTATAVSLLLLITLVDFRSDSMILVTALTSLPDEFRSEDELDSSDEDNDMTMTVEESDRKTAATALRLAASARRAYRFTSDSSDDEDGRDGLLLVDNSVIMSSSSGDDDEDTGSLSSTTNGLDFDDDSEDDEMLAEEEAEFRREAAERGSGRRHRGGGVHSDDDGVHWEDVRDREGFSSDSDNDGADSSNDEGGAGSTGDGVQILAFDERGARVLADGGRAISGHDNGCWSEDSSDSDDQESGWDGDDGPSELDLLDFDADDNDAALLFGDDIIMDLDPELLAAFAAGEGFESIAASAIAADGGEIDAAASPSKDVVSGASLSTEDESGVNSQRPLGLVQDGEGLMLLLEEDWVSGLFAGGTGDDSGGAFEFKTESEGDSDGAKDADRLDNLWCVFARASFSLEEYELMLTVSCSLRDDEYIVDRGENDGDTTDSLPEDEDEPPVVSPPSKAAANRSKASLPSRSQPPPPPSRASSVASSARDKSTSRPTPPVMGAFPSKAGVTPPSVSSGDGPSTSSTPALMKTASFDLIVDGRKGAAPVPSPFGRKRNSLGPGSAAASPGSPATSVPPTKKRKRVCLASSYLHVSPQVD